MYSGFWRRFVASLIDALVVGVAGSILRAAAGDTAGGLLTTLAGWLYFSVMESSEKQATLGKMALGIRVVDVDGNRVSFARATGRYFSKIISAMILLIGYIMAAFTAKKQALHDMIAGTLVVKD
ncbi:putative RDD family membrane protein YckC [Anaerobacterium chartisolvens]|uniref:Putative RDD family membrane protein YckC n=1 Tax=Anaerobacterium chartisolvens TaxID=1297424 RepID=A0A369B1A5_9FIRM|nr:RDD family protein [Anaerobacterium chartisolvens]RCX15460.1 putative RDD family membrane protein YckC [Anaerobacterium chartisolvens]